MLDQPRIIVDSALDRERALAQNPSSLAPPEVIAELELVEVDYVGFDREPHRGQIVVHKAAVADVRAFFEKAREIGFPIAKVIPICVPAYAWDDERSCDDNNSSGYNFRFIAGTTKRSKHARGLAFDINPVQNPYIRFHPDGSEELRAPYDARYDSAIPGTLVTADALVSLMKSRGWEWGGDWMTTSGRVDYQHFEKDLL